MPGPYSIVSEIPPKGVEDASAPWGVPPADRRPRQSTGRRPEPSRHTFLEQDVRIVLSQEISMENAPSRRNFLAAGLALPAAASASRSSGAGQSQTQPPVRSSSGAALQYRILGKTGLRVTTVGYGCMITSDPTVIARAVDMGINYFDTSRNYQNGQNERMVGAALGARRKDILLASKSSDNPSTGPGILAEIETSLKELNTDHLDVWHLHGLSNPAEITDELVQAAFKAKAQGKIRVVGVSTHNLPAIVDRVLEAKIDR